MGFLTTLMLLVFWVGTVNADPTPELVAPKFTCDLPKFKKSGDATNENRQLRKLKRRLDACVKTYKAKLRVQRESIVAIQKSTTNKAILAQIDEALIVIDSILASDLIAEPKTLPPDSRDFGPAQHAGGT